jgi:hypothetical protein
MLTVTLIVRPDTCKLCLRVKCNYSFPDPDRFHAASPVFSFFGVPNPAPQVTMLKCSLDQETPFLRVHFGVPFSFKKITGSEVFCLLLTCRYSLLQSTPHPVSYPDPRALSVTRYAKVLLHDLGKLGMSIATLQNLCVSFPRYLHCTVDYCFFPRCLVSL